MQESSEQKKSDRILANKLSAVALDLFSVKRRIPKEALLLATSLLASSYSARRLSLQASSCSASFVLGRREGDTASLSLSHIIFSTLRLSSVEAFTSENASVASLTRGLMARAAQTSSAF